MKLLSAAPVLLIGATSAFSPIVRRPVSSIRLHAAGGAPQYDKFDATLRSAEVVADGSCLLRIDAPGGGADYEPGHVLALEIETGDDVVEDADSKAQKDAKENGGWMRGPYTVTRASSEDTSFDVLIKVVGEKSRRFANAESGTPVRFGGKFHVPIVEGIDSESTKRVVMVSTGVGVGPCVGAIEKALDMESFPPIDLIASYRTEEEVAFGELLDGLKEKHPSKLAWKAIVTSESGRLSATEENMKALTVSTFEAGLDDTHYHLIGNGQMVSEFKSGLAKAGVPDDKVTVEMYFNHRAEVDEGAVDRIAAAVASSARAGATA